MSKLKHQKSKITVIEDSESLDSNDLNHGKNRHLSILLPDIKLTSPKFKLNPTSPSMMNVLRPSQDSEFKKSVRPAKTTKIEEGKKSEDTGTPSKDELRLPS